MLPTRFARLCLLRPIDGRGHLLSTPPRASGFARNPRRHLFRALLATEPLRPLSSTTARPALRERHGYDDLFDRLQACTALALKTLQVRRCAPVRLERPYRLTPHSPRPPPSYLPFSPKVVPKPRFSPAPELIKLYLVSTALQGTHSLIDVCWGWKGNGCLERVSLCIPS